MKADDTGLDIGPTSRASIFSPPLHMGLIWRSLHGGAAGDGAGVEGCGGVAGQWRAGVGRPADGGGPAWRRTEELRPSVAGRRCGRAGKARAWFRARRTEEVRHGLAKWRRADGGGAAGFSTEEVRCVCRRTWAGRRTVLVKN